jgi:SAM-dependent methyltransferase
VAETPLIQWSDEGVAHSARWQSERGAPPPAKVSIVDDRITADEAYALATQGIGLLWRGDFQNARQILTAMATRVEREPRRPRKSKKVAEPRSPADEFNLERQARAQRARTLGMLLVPFDAEYVIPLRRAPDLREACIEAYGPPQGAFVVSLRELLGVNSAHEWRRKGISIPAAGGRLYPYYGVFSPIRSEYIDLVAKAPLPAGIPPKSVAFDIGTGTGVLAAVLARRGFGRVIATDLDPRALACASENLKRLELSKQVEVVQADLFPEGRAAVALCNPPWVPARPSSPLEHGIYDFESRMLLGFLRGLTSHLEPGGEGWLILSDLAEHLGLRSRADLLGWIESAGLTVANRIDVRPKHPKASDASDPLHQARAAEVTSLWVLRPAQ